MLTQFWMRSAHRALLFACALGLGVGLTANLAHAAPTKVDKDAALAGKEAMQFRVVSVCEAPSSCTPAVLAQGWITNQTVSAAKSAQASWPAKAVIIFNSDGGDLLAAMDLGQWLRANQYNTRVGSVRPLKTSAVAPAPAAVELASGRCLSACVLSFLGGVQRTLDPADVIGFHGLVIANSALNAPGGGGASGVEKAQAAMNALGRYIESMGADRRMVDFMLFAKGEQFQRIPYDSAKQLGIDNQVQQPLQAWRLQATDSGELLAIVSEKQTTGNYAMTLAISRAPRAEAPNELRLIVYVKPIGKKIAAAEYRELSSETLSMKLLTRKDIVRGKLVSGWRANGEGAQLMMAFPMTSLEALTQTLGFEVELDLPANNLGLDRLTKFGTQGLRGALVALKK